MYKRRTEQERVALRTCHGIPCMSEGSAMYYKSIAINTLAFQKRLWKHETQNLI